MTHDELHKRVRELLYGAGADAGTWRSLANQAAKQAGHTELANEMLKIAEALEALEVSLKAVT